MRRKSNHVVQNALIDIDHLQNVTGPRSEQVRVLNDEQLFLLRRPHKAPRAGEGRAGGDRVAARDGQGVDCLDDFREPGGVVLSPEASVLVGDQVEEVALGGGGGEGLVGEGRAGESSGSASAVSVGIGEVRVRVWTAGNGGKGEDFGHFWGFEVWWRRWWRWKKMAGLWEISGEWC